MFQERETAGSIRLPILPQLQFYWLQRLVEFIDLALTFAPFFSLFPVHSYSLSFPITFHLNFLGSCANWFVTIPSVLFPPLVYI